MKAYLIDEGVLLKENDLEFSRYNHVYDHKYGYYDENQYYGVDKEKAIKEAKEYVKKGVDNTYGIVSRTEIDTKKEGTNIPVENENYDVEDIIVGYAKMNGNVIELFSRKHESI